MKNKIAIKIRFEPQPLFLKRVRKFTDEELLEVYKLGLTDSAMARELGCSRGVVAQRRVKLGLVANHLPVCGKRLTKEELEERRIENIKRIAERNKLKRQKRADLDLHYKEKHKTYRLEHQSESYNKHREKILARVKKRSEIPEVKSRIKKYMAKYSKEYYQKNKEKALRYARERMANPEIRKRKLALQKIYSKRYYEKHKEYFSSERNKQRMR